MNAAFSDPIAASAMKSVKRFTKWVAIAFVAVVVFGALYNALQATRALKHNPSARPLIAARGTDGAFQDNIGIPTKCDSSCMDVDTVGHGLA